MGGERPFDDDRWPDEEGFAVCFMCGRKVDPRDPARGSYTGNVKACEPLPIHLPCVDGIDITVVLAAFMAAINQMGQLNARKAREAAGIANGPVSSLGIELH